MDYWKLIKNRIQLWWWLIFLISFPILSGKNESHYTEDLPESV